MDYPSLVIPVTKVDPEVDVKLEREEFWSEDDKGIHDMCMFHFLFPRLRMSSALPQMTLKSSKDSRLASNSSDQVFARKSSWAWEEWSILP